MFCQKCGTQIPTTQFCTCGSHHIRNASKAVAPSCFPPKTGIRLRCYVFFMFSVVQNVEDVGTFRYFRVIY